MNPPPDVYDAKGQPYPERRTGGDRRDDAPPPDVARGWAMWAELMFFHRGKVIAFAVSITSFLTYGATAVGMRYVGPRQEVERVDMKVDTLTLRVIRLENAIVSARDEREDLNRKLGWVIYMQCRTQKRLDPTDLPPICDEPTKP